MTRHRLLGVLLAGAVATGVVAGPASAAPLPPSLTTDTGFAFPGVVEYDFTVTPGISRDTAAGAAFDPDRGRHYAVGATSDGSDDDIAVVARLADGSLDTSFAGDGALALEVTPAAHDEGLAMLVLPDGRMRIAGHTDAGADGLDAVVVGLLPDGSPDPAFGVDGISRLPLGAGEDRATALAADALGRLAVTGGSDDRAFVALLDPAGTPDPAFGAAGVTLLDLADGAASETGNGVAWTPGGIAVLTQADDGGGVRSALLRGLEGDGDADTGFGTDGVTEIDPGGTDTTGTGLLAHGGALWAVGSAVVDGDTDAYVARTDESGAGVQTRRFDIRGTHFPPSQKVETLGLALALVSGEPDTLVVSGVVGTDAGNELAVAAFNRLGGPVAELASAELVIPVSGQGEAYGIAAGPEGAAAVSSTLLDYSLETGSGTNDTSIGLSRVLVDAEKRCDLALFVVSPLELVMRGKAPSEVTLSATNRGTRACGGEVTVPEPWSMEPALETGKLDPGDSTTLETMMSYGAPLPPSGVLDFTLVSPTDAAPGDNGARLGVLFSFCDLVLEFEERPRYMGRQGARRFGFSVHNRGTTTCPEAIVAVGGAGKRKGKPEPFSVPAGQSVTDEVMVKLRRGAASGQRSKIVFATFDLTDVDPENGVLETNPMVVRTGDTNADEPRRGRIFEGSSRRGVAAGVRRGLLKVKRVEVAIRARGKGCRWVADRDGAFRKVLEGCEPLWIKARGRDDWRLRLEERLPAGKYLLLTRAVLRNGVPEGAFSKRDRNKIKFRVR